VTDEELGEIRETLETRELGPDYWNEAAALLAEVDRLRGENERLIEKMQGQESTGEYDEKWGVEIVWDGEERMRRDAKVR
jgi:hypothetical protein